MTYAQNLGGQGSKIEIDASLSYIVIYKLAYHA